ncbi:MULTISPECIES: hypothetical protein [Vibrio]|uniref:Uncharacterized protein n=1 Tax=Vibrio genomosp. F6 str. FF-238 TaxID=1191298 RepID=A0A1E5CL78_9VIBR|nr:MULTISPECIES: hypothetical protein [Vibrio]OEE69461.1 hypothetical protein A130_09250 [Vibrio genomosp. F6 str. FF-238]
MTSPYANGEIYYDNEPNVGVNAYFSWGHHFFACMSDFRAHVELSQAPNSYELIEITDDNYRSLCRIGVFAHVC